MLIFEWLRHKFKPIREPVSPSLISLVKHPIQSPIKFTDICYDFSKLYLAEAELISEFSEFYQKRNVIVKRTTVKVLLFKVNNCEWFKPKMVRYHKQNNLKVYHCLDLTITINIDRNLSLISKCFSDWQKSKFFTSFF